MTVWRGVNMVFGEGVNKDGSWRGRGGGKTAIWWRGIRPQFGEGGAKLAHP